ncbi:MAG: fumarylacetoacetate hydrolase family protein, partial [Gammaproteobacteria bacterium]
MKLATFSYRGITRIGAVDGDFVVDGLGDDKIPRDMISFLSGGEKSLEAMRALADGGGSRIGLAAVKLEAPVPRPGKYLAVSLNYGDHIEETGREKPEYPTFFNKQTTCVIAHGAGIQRPRVSDKVDYEGELAFVIGKRCRHVP